MSTVVKYFGLLIFNLRLNLASAMEYRFSFWSQVLFMLLNNTFLLFFWWVFFTNFPAVQGWTFRDILLLYSLVAGSFGIASLLGGNSLRLGDAIAQGELDFYLLLPVNPLFNVLTSRMQVSALGDLAFALVLAPLAVGANPANLLLLVLFLFCGGLVLVSFFTITGCLSFFWGHNQGVASLAQNAILLFATYPEYIFSGLVRMMLFTIIPAAFVAHVPLALLQEFQWPKLALLLAGVLAVTLLACRLFQLGLKKYESGNLMATRI